MLEHRQHIVETMVEAVASGARLSRVCEEVGIALSTYRRWQDEGSVLQDRKPNAESPAPGSRLALEEREQLLSVFHEPELSLRFSVVPNRCISLTAPVCAVARVKPAFLIKWVESTRWTIPGPCS